MRNSVAYRMYRTLLLWMIAVAGAGCSREDPLWVAIPDQALLNAVIRAGADRDGDGRISQEEAASVTSLDIPPSGIRSLEGLLEFIHLDTLSVDMNPLDSLDLRDLPAIRYLDCSNCDLVALDLTGNSGLIDLNCGRNRLKELDLSGIPSLRKLACNNNLLDQINLKSNPMLEKMISCGNRLQLLDLSANTSLNMIGIDNMPMLSEVCVWILPFPPDGVEILMEYSPGVIFTTDCP
jgi:Leucine-rich repeat (LRR) protein